MSLTGNSFTSIMNKHKPIPIVGGASFKPATIGLGGIKTKLKLNSQMSSDSQPQQRLGALKAVPLTQNEEAQISARSGQLSARGNEAGGQLSARGAAYTQNAQAVYN